MAIAFHAGGTAAAGTTSCAPGYPTVSAGDLIIMEVVSKYPPNNPSTTGGFLEPANNRQSGGSGSSGADTGNVTTTLFVKEATGSETGTETVTVTSGNSVSARMFSYSKDARATWAYALENGSDNSAGTSWSVTTGTINLAVNDVLLAFSGVNTDLYTFSSEAAAAFGITFAGATERMDATSGQGDDHARVMSEHPITAGSGTVAVTYTMTASGTATDNPAGSTVIIRLRESFLIDVPVATLASTKFAPVVSKAVVSGLATLVAAGLAPAAAKAVTPGVASLATTKFAPTVAKSVPVPLKSLVLTGYPPTANNGSGSTIVPDVAALFITGKVPQVVVVRVPVAIASPGPAPRALERPAEASLSGTGFRTSLPMAALRDRADVLRREMVVSDGRAGGVKESMLAGGVRCLVRALRTSRLATLLGQQPVAQFEVYLGREPEVHAGYVFRVNGVRYLATSVARWPSPHRYDFQVAEAVLDVAEARA